MKEFLLRKTCLKPTILDKITSGKSRNPVKLDNTRKL